MFPSIYQFMTAEQEKLKPSVYQFISEPEALLHRMIRLTQQANTPLSGDDGDLLFGAKLYIKMSKLNLCVNVSSH